MPLSTNVFLILSFTAPCCLNKTCVLPRVKFRENYWVIAQQTAFQTQITVNQIIKQSKETNLEYLMGEKEKLKSKVNSNMTGLIIEIVNWQILSALNKNRERHQIFWRKAINVPTFLIYSLETWQQSCVGSQLVSLLLPNNIHFIKLQFCPWVLIIECMATEPTLNHASVDP